MPHNKIYRYHLPSKAIKVDCPQCGPRYRKTLSRYVDSQTGELLPETYGRCDRESNCGYHFSPYHKAASGLSYADTVYQNWKASNQLQSSYPVKAAPPTKSAKLKPDAIYTIPDEIVKQSLGHYGKNQFARLLQRQFGVSVADALLQRFQIGTSSRWPGACVFWLIDEHGRARSGQVVLFNDDWHKGHYTNQQGESNICISSVSHSLLRRYSKQGQPVPDWLTDYDRKAPRWPILFGLHQLATAPIDMLVALVEAPKTAVACSALIPSIIWLAIGALSYLNAERLAPLRGRSVMLYPDLSKDGMAFAKWSRIASDLNKKGYQISVSDYLEQRATDKQKAQGLDLADFLLMPETTQPRWILNGQTEYGTVLAVEPYCTYPAEWDDPNAPDAVPTLKVKRWDEY